MTGFQYLRRTAWSWGNVTGCAMERAVLGTCGAPLRTANSRECDRLGVRDATGTAVRPPPLRGSSQISPPGLARAAACTARVCGRAVGVQRGLPDSVFRV
ncbi:MAG: hypothetical protein IPH72_31525 [Sandaracinaceae bacterium]|nr:hypothetical protein [Sandaracinaceae bacterium]